MLRLPLPALEDEKREDGGPDYDQCFFLLRFLAYSTGTRAISFSLITARGALPTLPSRFLELRAQVPSYCSTGKMLSSDVEVPTLKRTDSASSAAKKEYPVDEKKGEAREEASTDYDEDEEVKVIEKDEEVALEVRLLSITSLRHLT